MLKSKSPLTRKVEKVVMLSTLMLLGILILFGQLIPFLVSMDNDLSVIAGAILALAGIVGIIRLGSIIFQIIITPIEENTNQNPNSHP